MNYFDVNEENVACTRKSNFWIFFCVLTLLSLFVFLYYAPVYKGDDFYFHYRRFQALINALFIDKTFPSYIDYAAVNGYGYMSNTFYPDLILVPFALIGYLTDAFFGYNFMLVSMTVLCGVLMYYVVDKIYNNNFISFTASLLYTFSVYRLLDEYNRAALGEYLSFTFLPLIFLGGYYIIKGNYKQWYVLTIGYSLLIYTHILSSLLVSLLLALFLIIYWRSLKKEPKRILYLAISSFSTIIIVSYYLFPMIEQILDQSFYFQTQAWMEPRYEKLDLLVILKGFYSDIMPNNTNYKPAIGILLVAPLFLRFFIKKSNSEYIKSADKFVFIGFILIIIASSIAPWGRFPLNLLKVIQYPWRLFEFSSFFFAIAIAIYISDLVKTKKTKLIVSIVTIIAICYVTVNNANFYNDVLYKEKTELQLPTTKNYALGGGLEYIPANTPTLDFVLERGDIIETSSEAETNLIRNGRYTYIVFNSDSPDLVTAPLLYYKGYVAVIDGQETLAYQNHEGFVQTLATGKSIIQIYYKGTLTQQLSFYASLFSVLALCIYIFIFSKQERKFKKNTLNEGIK